MKKNLQQTSSSAIFVVFSSNVLSKIIGFLLVVVFASTVGTSSDGDAYTFAFILPDLVNHLLAGSALSIAFIPIFQELSDNQEKQNRFFSNIFTIGTIVFVSVLLICFFATPFFVKILAGNSITTNIQTFELTVKLTRIVLPAQLFFFWGAIFIGVQQANKNYKFSALAPIVYDTIIIIFGLVFFKFIGIAGFSWGVLFGAFVGHTLIQFFGAKRFSIKYSPYINIKDKDFLQWFYKTIPLALGLGITFSNEFTFRFFGSRIENGQGAIVALNYAYKIVMIIVVLFGSSIAGTIYPFLSEKAKEKKYDEMENFLIPIFVKTTTIIIIITATIYPISGDIISLLFERKAFDSQSVILTSKALIGYLPGIFFLSAVIILQRLFYAIKNTKTPLIISTVSLILSIPFYKILSDLWGIIGISSATSVFSAIATILTVWRWHKFYPHTKLLSAVKPVLIAILIAAVVVIIEFCTIRIIREFMFIRILRVCLISFPAITFSAIMFQFFKIIDIKDLFTKTVRKVVRR
ncbi:MAG: murein biosynthesis integral membrane protein MurJ [Chitinispirillales bacterium]|jgi:putative peptidoglycan lipid II flippase|nr:murein biosynthesis integral membrane protein MurJ [Chitinispirillales bacterium]